MKKIAMMALVLSLSFSTGCTTSNNAGRCIGVLDQKKAGTEYNLNYWNIFVAVIFVETLIVPAVVILKMLECPAEG